MATTESALAHVVSMLAAEGYELVVADDGSGTVRLTVNAGPEACEYCLVPKGMLESIARKHLGEGGLNPQLEIVYPGERLAH